MCFQKAELNTKYTKAFCKKKIIHYPILKKTMKSEQAIQTNIKKKLEAEGYLIVKLIKTSCNGIPDLMALKEGETLFIEVKKENGVLSELQKERIIQLRAQGFEVKIWTDYGIDFKN